MAISFLSILYLYFHIFLKLPAVLPAVLLVSEFFLPIYLSLSLYLYFSLFCCPFLFLPVSLSGLELLPLLFDFVLSCCSTDVNIELPYSQLYPYQYDSHVNVAQITEVNKQISCLKLPRLCCRQSQFPFHHPPSLHIY